jgi:hypothetical protein
MPSPGQAVIEPRYGGELTGMVISAKPPFATTLILYSAVSEFDENPDNCANPGMSNWLRMSPLGISHETPSIGVKISPTVPPTLTCLVRLESLISISWSIFKMSINTTLLADSESEVVTVILN